MIKNKNNNSYDDFEQFEQRFAICVSIFLAYYRAKLARTFIEDNSQKRNDISIIEDLCIELSRWLLSGRVWIVDMDSEKIKLPFPAGISLIPIEYASYSEQGKATNRFYSLPFNTGYIAYSSSIYSPMFDSYITNKFSYGDLRDDFDESISLLKNFMTELNSSNFKKAREEYFKKDLSLMSEQKKNKVTVLSDELLKNISSFSSLIEKNIKDLELELDDSEVLVNSIFSSVKTGGDTVRLEFMDENMLIYTFSFFGIKKEKQGYSMEYFNYISKIFMEEYKENGCFYLNPKKEEYFSLAKFANTPQDV